MAHAIPLSQFYPYGEGVGDSVLPIRFDDGVSDAIPLIPGFRYFGSSYTNIYVSCGSFCNKLWLHAIHIEILAFSN
jgi:hypothetical protein